jgi:hypothetical protein
MVETDNVEVGVSKKHEASLSRLLLEGAVKGENLRTSPTFRRDVLHSMYNDAITKICKKDNAILKFGASLHKRLGRNRAHDISQRMRQLGRLVQSVNFNNVAEHISLNDCLSGENFDKVVEATQSLCGFFDDPAGRPMMKNPSLGLKLGHSLAKCGHVKIGVALRTGSTIMRQEAEAFLALHKAEWTNNFSSASLATLKHRAYNNPVLLSLTSDLVNLKDYQVEQITHLNDELLRSPSYSMWRNLMEQVYTRLVIFNKRQCGETAKLLLETYRNRPTWVDVA